MSPRASGGSQRAVAFAFNGYGPPGLGSRTNLRRLCDWLTFYIPAFYCAANMQRQDVVITLTTPPFIALAGWLHKILNPSAKFILWNMDVYPEALERTSLVKTGVESSAGSCAGRIAPCFGGWITWSASTARWRICFYRNTCRRIALCRIP